MKNMETEFKWDANTPRAFSRMLGAACAAARVEEPQKLDIRDIYLDSAGLSFEARQIAFRVRETDGKFEATFKTRTEIVDGKAVRREETLPLPEVKNITEALAFLNHKKTWEGLEVAALKKRFEIRNRRRTHAVFFDGAEFELAFDTCDILVCGRVVKMKEIELELKRGAAEKLDALATLLSRASGLAAMKCSKVKTACALLALWGDK